MLAKQNRLLPPIGPHQLPTAHSGPDFFVLVLEPVTGTPEALPYGEPRAAGMEAASMTAEETVDWLASLSSETLDLLALEISEPQAALAHAKSLLAIWLETGQAVRDVIETGKKEVATPAPVSQTLPIPAANDGGSRIAASLRRLLPFGSFGQSVGGSSVDFGEVAAASPGDVAGERSMESMQRELDAWMSMFARYEEEVKEYEKDIKALREQVKSLANGGLGGNAEERGQDAQTVETEPAE